jgi:hypothetical protein
VNGIAVWSKTHAASAMVTMLAHYGRLRGAASMPTTAIAVVALGAAERDDIAGDDIAA